MDKKLKDKLALRTYEIGYAKPPPQGQFIKGRSGNPKGRPKTKKAEPKRNSKPATIDVTTRDLVLQFAARVVGARAGDGGVRVTAEEAVMHSQLSAAVKGNSNAQKSFLDRVERCRAELKAEIDEDHEFWRGYCEAYPKTVESLRRTGKSAPIEWPHPEDLVFQEGEHVMIRGGDTVEAIAACEAVIRLREAYMLQSVMDERAFQGPLKSNPIFLSAVLAVWANESLPKRMQLDDTRYLLQCVAFRRLSSSDLKRAGSKKPGSRWVIQNIRMCTHRFSKTTRWNGCAFANSSEFRFAAESRSFEPVRAQLPSPLLRPILVTQGLREHDQRVPRCARADFRIGA